MWQFQSAALPPPSPRGGDSPHCGLRARWTPPCEVYSAPSAAAVAAGSGSARAGGIGWIGEIGAMCQLHISVHAFLKAPKERFAELPSSQLLPSFTLESASP